VNFTLWPGEYLNCIDYINVYGFQANEREAYRILKESSDYFEQSKQLDSLIELKMAGRDSLFFQPQDTIGELP